MQHRYIVSLKSYVWDKVFTIASDQRDLGCTSVGEVADFADEMVAACGAQAQNGALVHVPGDQNSCIEDGGQRASWGVDASILDCHYTLALLVPQGA
jgi:hypothetical protein